MTSHPSALTLEQLTVDDLPAAARATAAQHVEGCATCQAKVAEFEAARVALRSRTSATAFATTIRARSAQVVALRRRRMVVAAVTAACALAAGLVFMLRPVDHGRTGWKGAGLAIHRLRAGQVRVLTVEDRLRAGDGLRVVLTLQRPEQVTAWFEDAHGRIDRLTDAPLALEAGEHALPNSGTVENPCVDLSVVVSVVGSNERLVERLRCE